MILILSAILAVLAAVSVFLIVSEHKKADDRLRASADLFESEKKSLNEKILNLTSEKEALKARIEAATEMETRLREEQERRERMMAERHEKELKQMKEVFENLSSRNSEAFKERSAATIAELLKPVQDKFKEFSESVKESQKENADRHSKLDQRITDLDARSRAVSDEARNLANALTGYSKVQGDFGEMLLSDVLKNAGLLEGVHFTTQGVLTDEAGHEIKSEGGKTMIPDVMVYYPDDTTVIVDSKVSLKAYSEYMAAATVEARTAAAKAHVESVRKHVDELKNKDYASYIPKEKRKVDYNIMFIPMEGAFRLMLEEDPLLWQAAKDNKVLIVSQMTLIIVLNMIQMSWKQHEQEKNISDVYDTAEELMSQLRNWMESFVKVGESLDRASSAYSDSKKKLVESNQSVIRKIDKLERLKVGPKRSNGKTRTSSRITGAQSIIPQALASGIESEE